MSLAASLWLGGCAASSSSLTSQSLVTQPTGSGSTSSTTPPVAPVSVLSGGVLSGGSETLLPLGNTPTIDVSSTELYSRVAGGALKCWFGADGPLKSSHVFNADAAPPSRGGAAEITVHERDSLARSQAASRGIRAFRISIEPIAADKARLSLQAGKLAPDLAAALEKDALAYAYGRTSCEAQVVRPPPPPPIADKAKPARQRPALRAAVR